MRIFQKLFLITAMVIWILTGCGKSIEQQVMEQLELGSRYLSELDYEQAIVAFCKAIELEPREIQAYTSLISVYLKSGQPENAEQTVADATKLFVTSDTDVDAGKMQGFLNQAVVYYESQKELEDICNYWKGVLLILGKKDEYQDSLQGNTQSILERCMKEAEQSLDVEDIQSAIAILEVAIEMTPSSSDGYGKLADIYISQKEWDKAIEILQRGYENTGDDLLNEKLSELNKSSRDISKDGLSLSPESICEAMINASIFAWNWFWDSSREIVDENDTYIGTSENGYYDLEYKCVIQEGVHSVDDVFKLTKHYFTEEIAEKLIAQKSWYESGDKLYMSEPDGIGGTNPDYYDVTICKDSDIQYTITVSEYFFGELVSGPYDIHYEYIDGYWVFDQVLCQMGQIVPINLLEEPYAIESAIEDNEYLGDVQDRYVGEYLDLDNKRVNLEIRKGKDGKYIVQIEIFRLTSLNDGIGELTADGLRFTATDDAGNPIMGLITLENRVATVVFTDSTYNLIEDGSSFQYIKNSDIPNIWVE